MRTVLRSNHNVVFSCKYHVVWCPKYRRKVFVDGIDERLKAIIRSVVAERDATVIEMEVMPDHVHLLVEVDPQFGIHSGVLPAWRIPATVPARLGLYARAAGSLG